MTRYTCPNCGYSPMRIFPRRIMRPTPMGPRPVTWYVAQCPRCGYMKRVG